MMHLIPRTLSAGLAVLFCGALAATAQPRASHCIAVAQGPERIHAASFGQPLDAFTVRLSFVDHATFLIESPAGVVAATDYAGFLGTRDVVPDIVTMNNAHRTHFTDRPDPRIPHVLRGWAAEPGQEAVHDIVVGDMRVRNVTTDIRGGFAGVRPAGNSIFVFEVEGLCIAHLGHLHHEPDDMQYASLGRIDIVLVPVDGGYTMSLEAMIRVLERLRASVVVPMHWFGEPNLQRFLAGMRGRYEIVEPGGRSLEVSLRSLPSRPRVHVLRPGFLND